MAITPFSTPLPNTATMTEAQFNKAMNRFFSELANFGIQINAVANAFNFNATNSTSATSIPIGTGSKSLTVETSKSYVPGMTLRIASTASTASPVTGCKARSLAITQAQWRWLLMSPIKLAVGHLQHGPSRNLLSLRQRLLIIELT